MLVNMWRLCFQFGIANAYFVCWTSKRDLGICERIWLLCLRDQSAHIHLRARLLLVFKLFLGHQVGEAGNSEKLSQPYLTHTKHSHSLPIHNADDENRVVRYYPDLRRKHLYV
jgi:hypothetical protein